MHILRWKLGPSWTVQHLCRLHLHMHLHMQMCSTHAHSQVEAWPELDRAAPLSAALAHALAHANVQYTCTFSGGSLARVGPCSTSVGCTCTCTCTCKCAVHMHMPRWKLGPRWTVQHLCRLHLHMHLHMQ